MVEIEKGIWLLELMEKEKELLMNDLEKWLDELIEKID